MKDPMLFLKWCLTIVVVTILIFGEVKVSIKFPADQKQETNP